MRIARARFLTDTTHCPIVTTKSVCPTTVSDRGSGPQDTAILFLSQQADYILLRPPPFAFNSGSVLGGTVLYVDGET